MKTERLPRVARGPRRLRARAPRRARSATGARGPPRGLPEPAGPRPRARRGRAPAAARRPRALRPGAASRRPSWASGSRRRSAPSGARSGGSAALRFGFGLGGAAAAAAAAVLAIFVLSGGERGGPEQHVAFRSLPGGVKIAATLEPQAFGTEIHMYVKGSARARSAASTCAAAAARVSAGTFRYRWGDGASAVLSAALDLSPRQSARRPGRRPNLRRAGRTTPSTALRNQSQQEEST